MILTLEQACEQLRYEPGEQDNYLLDLVQSAEQAIKDYLGAGFNESNFAQQQAAKLLIGFYDAYRNVEGDMPKNGNYLPEQVVALLYKYRTPVAI